MAVDKHIASVVAETGQRQFWGSLSRRPACVSNVTLGTQKGSQTGSTCASSCWQRSRLKEPMDYCMLWNYKNSNQENGCSKQVQKSSDRVTQVLLTEHKLRAMSVPRCLWTTLWCAKNSKTRCSTWKWSTLHTPTRCEERAQCVERTNKLLGLPLRLPGVS